MRSSDYNMHLMGSRVDFGLFWGICKVWLQTRMCLDAIPCNITKKSNKRICVWWQEAMYVYVFDTWPPQTHVCLIPNDFQTRMCAECVRNVCGTCFFVFGIYVDKNKAYLRVCICFTVTNALCLYANMQIYIKNIAKAHVLCALLRYHNKRACVWLENRKRFRFFFHCSSRFGFPCCAAFSSACCRSHERQAGNGGNPPGRRDEWAGCSDWSCTWLWNSICVAYGQNLIRATYMLNTSICALRHKREGKKQAYTQTFAWKQTK